MKQVKALYRSPIGWIEVTGTDEGLASLFFVGRPSEDRSVRTPEALRPAIRQLDEYFRGKRRRFTTPVLLRGTAFQQSVWSELRQVPFGRTVSYGALAKSLGKPGAARAVGLANHLNPLSIIIPCHRVVGHDGALVGYGGGLWRKRWLLAHEKALGGTGGKRRPGRQPSPSRGGR